MVSSRSARRRPAIDSASDTKSSASSQHSPDLHPPVSAPPDAHSTRSAASSSNKSDSMRSSNKRSKEESSATDEFQQPAPPPSSSHRRTSSIASTANANASRDAQHPPPTSTSTSSKRKGKGKNSNTRSSPKEDAVETASVAHTDADAPMADEKVEDDGGVTRCVCEGSEDDGGFMVQCELCMAWQHGPCMGFASESDIPEGDYYCEQCKPEDHTDLLKKLNRRQRQSSEKSSHAVNANRVSRSHSPTQFKAAAKRRNTMNSRDAAYEEQLQRLLESTAAEAGTTVEEATGADKEGDAKEDDVAEEIVIEIGPGGRKKRKRADDEVMSTKRKRSASDTERNSAALAAMEKPPSDITTPVTTEMLPPPTPVNNKSRSRRGGNRKGNASTTQEPSINGDAEEAPPLTKKHPNQYTYRAKSGNNQSRRAPQSMNGSQPNGSSHEHGTRRNANQSAMNGAGANTRGGNAGASAWNNSNQLPLFQSWGLPDYLSHLQQILPWDVPPPLMIRGPSSFMRDLNPEADDADIPTTTGTSTSGTVPPFSTDQPDSAPAPSTHSNKTSKSIPAMEDDSAHDTISERGAKVKWPAKRMSVADMNKRVRALMDWVGREQNLAHDRERRKVALEVSLGSSALLKQDSTKGGVETKDSEEEDRMAVDGKAGSTSDASGAGPSTATETDKHKHQNATSELTSAISPTSATLDAPPRCSTPRSMFAAALPNGGALGVTGRMSTTKMMEELMEELINFQERFGPGAKGTLRDKRAVAVV